MRASISACLVFALTLACAQAKKATEAELLATMTLSTNMLQDAFDGLDVNSDKKIDLEDLKIHYYLPEGEFAKEKFIDMINTDTNRDICKTELDVFMKKQTVTNVVWECTYLHSKSVRHYCYADQLAWLIMLVPDQAARTSFFSSLDTNNDKKITKAEAETLKGSTFNEVHLANLFMELGGKNGEISEREFHLYISGDNILPKFRACRGKITGCNAEYNNECMKTQLMRWTTYHMTEKDMMAIFDEFEDDNDGDIHITESDIKKVSGCDDTVAKKFVQLMDKTNDQKVTYGEFRTYALGSMVRRRMEKDCSSKGEDQATQVQCYKKDIIKRVEQSFKPWLMRNGDMDVTFFFEHMDENNDGQISEAVDLVQGHHWPQPLAHKAITEMDGPDANTNVDLSEWCDYVHTSYIAFGIAQCLTKGRNLERMKCFQHQLKDMMGVMMEKPDVEGFFSFYDTDDCGAINRAEVEAKGVTGTDLQNFMDEMGMGDETIVMDEFENYVRQQDLSHKFKDGSCNKHEQRHGVLVKYQKHEFTQFDTQELFKAMDTDGDWEIATDDFVSASTEVTKLIKIMDSADKDNSVNFREFWAFLNSPVESPRKIQLAKSCVKDTQSEQLGCFKEEIKKFGK